MVSAFDSAAVAASARDSDSPGHSPVLALLPDHEHSESNLRQEEHDAEASASASVSKGSADDQDSEEDTEDEEVKINCIRGVQGVLDSDMASDDGGSDDENVDEWEEPANDDGPVIFVEGQLPQTGGRILKPTARQSKGQMDLYPHEEEEDEDKSDSSSCGARGVPCSLESPASHLSTDAYVGDKDENSESDDDNSEESDRDEVDDSHVAPCEISEGEARVGLEEFRLSEEAEVGGRSGVIQIPKAKRVLSSNTLAALNRDYGQEYGMALDSPKRLRCSASQQVPLMPSLSLGPSAVDLLPPSLRMRALEDSNSSSTEDEDLDRQLTAELDPAETCSRSSRENTPVPLLTPPQSPLTVEVDEGTTTTICEWPSNLAVDNALTAASRLRPLSPGSLEQLEQDEEERMSSQKRISNAQSSTLTPLLRGIYVGIE